MSVAKTVWEYLTDAGMTKAGAAGMMGNIKAESGMIPDRVEILCLQRLREIGQSYTDATYTAAVVSGKITKEQFLHPLPGRQYGYGLVQWTSPSRKAGLYDLCKKWGVSIGDTEAQLAYLVQELKYNYPSVWNVLKTTVNVREASDIVLTRFECPADTGDGVRNNRYNMSMAYYNEFSKTETTGVTAQDIIDIERGWIGYNEYNGLYKQIVDIYNNYCATHGYPRGYRVPYGVAWCDVTQSAAFIKAGAVDLIGGVECGVEEHIKIFKQKGIWIEDGSITPKKGYIITYNWDSPSQPNDGYADHIGLVTGVSGNMISVIEGNYNDAVGERVIPVGWGYIRGYAAPKYADKPEKPSEKPVEKPAEKPGVLSTEPKWVGEVTADLLNVRTWAGTEYPNIKSWPRLAFGNLVDVCDTIKDASGNDWYFVRIAGKVYGFVSAQYIKRV